jgi:hypothetical protein
VRGGVPRYFEGHVAAIERPDGPDYYRLGTSIMLAAEARQEMRYYGANATRNLADPRLACKK